MNPWDRLPTESVRSFEKFQTYLHAGTIRSQAAVARAHGITRASVHELSHKHDWQSRAAAWDSANSVDNAEAENALATAAVLHRPDADSTVEQGSDHLEALLAFRETAERLGRDQMRVARLANAVAGKGLAAMMQSNKPLSARDVAVLAGVASQLGAAGSATWSRSIGVDALINRLRFFQELETADLAILD